MLMALGLQLRTMSMVLSLQVGIKVLVPKGLATTLKVELKEAKVLTLATTLGQTKTMTTSRVRMLTAAPLTAVTMPIMATLVTPTMEVMISGVGSGPVHTDLQQPQPL
jgi:hypothetical protein